MDNMTAEAKAAVMQLMGQTYGAQKKQDQMIVGASGNLSPKSDEMREMVEQLVKSPTAPGREQRQQYPQDPQQQPQQPQQPQQQPQAQPAPAPAGPPAPVTPEQALAELQQAPVTPPLEVNAFAPVEVAPVQEEQLGFDFSEPSALDQLLAAVKENTLLLKDIKLQLDNTNVRPKRKSVKSKVAG